MTGDFNQSRSESLIRLWSRHLVEEQTTTIANFEAGLKTSRS